MPTFGGFNPRSKGKKVVNEGTFVNIVDASGFLHVVVNQYPVKRAWINYMPLSTRAAQYNATIQNQTVESGTVDVFFTRHQISGFLESGFGAYKTFKTIAAGSANISGDSYAIWTEGN